MSKCDKIGLRGELENFLKNRGAFKVRVANPSRGFEKAINGCHPRDVMRQCNSVIVFAVYMGPDYYRTVKFEGKTQGDDRIGHIFRDWLSHELAALLRNRGFNALVPTGYLDRAHKIARFSHKLAAFEAGIGVYGKSGLIITPEYGPRVNIGVVVADAILEPDDRLDFDPCRACEICAKVCPAKAIQENSYAPVSYDRAECVNFIDRLREETVDANFLCGYCYEYCPTGKSGKRGFLVSQNKALVNLKRIERDTLIQKATRQ